MTESADDQTPDKLKSRRWRLAWNSFRVSSACALVGVGGCVYHGQLQNISGILAAYSAACLAILGGYGFTRSHLAGGREETP